VKEYLLQLKVQQGILTIGISLSAEKCVKWISSCLSLLEKCFGSPPGKIYYFAPLVKNLSDVHGRTEN